MKWSASLPVVSNSLWPHGLGISRLFCPWDSPGKNTWAGCHFLLQEIFLIQGSNLGFLHYRQTLYHLSNQGSSIALTLRAFVSKMMSLLFKTLSGFDIAFLPMSSKIWKQWGEVKLLSRVWLFATPWAVAFKAPPFMGFSRQEYWSGLPSPSPGIKPYGNLEEDISKCTRTRSQNMVI